MCFLKSTRLAVGGPAGRDLSLGEPDANKADFERPTSLALDKGGNSLAEELPARLGSAPPADKHSAAMPLKATILFRITVPIFLIVDYRFRRIGHHLLPPTGLSHFAPGSSTETTPQAME